MNLPTWGDLYDHHCTIKKVGGDPARTLSRNPFYEDMSVRRYNCSPAADTTRFRLVFLRGVLDNPENKTLVRNGRFIWCTSLNYEGRREDGLRQISFTVDKGHKRFIVAEDNVLCIPSKIFINNNRFFRPKDKTFAGFASVFAYQKAINVMATARNIKGEDLREVIRSDSPFGTGTLVGPRLGYFYPALYPALGMPNLVEQHPCGIILGKSFSNEEYGREFYRVRFGKTTYERVHPIQMEIINEV